MDKELIERMAKKVGITIYRDGAFGSAATTRNL